jgi:hypothetical protein
MKIRITLIDEENNHVRLECHPTLPKIIEEHKRGNASAALTYAVLGLSKMMGDSDAIAREQEHGKSGLLMPSHPSFKMPPIN